MADVLNMSNTTIITNNTDKEIYYIWTGSDSAPSLSCLTPNGVLSCHAFTINSSKGTLTAFDDSLTYKFKTTDEITISLKSGTNIKVENDN